MEKDGIVADVVAIVVVVGLEHLKYIIWSRMGL